MIIIALVSTTLAFFLLWNIKSLREKYLQKVLYEKAFAATVDASIASRAREQLNKHIQSGPKQPQLWWGNECITISHDGKRVVKFTKPDENNETVGVSELAKAILAGESIPPLGNRNVLRIPMDKKGNPMDFVVTAMPLTEKRW